jgi:hypothetical protein
MTLSVRITKAELDGLIVTFSDGTIGAYVAEELLELRPERESIEVPHRVSGSKRGKNGRPPALSRK